MLSGAFQVALLIKNLLAYAGDVRDTGSTPGLGRSLGEGHDNPLQYSCLENSMDGGAFGATVHGVTKSRTGLSDFHFTSLLYLPCQSILSLEHSKCYKSLLKKV